MPVPVAVGGTMTVVPIPWKKQSINLRLDGNLEEIIFRDVARVFEEAGYVVAREATVSGEPPVVFSIEVLEVWVESFPGKWFESQGRLTAAVLMKLVVVDETAREVLWEERADGEETKGITYALKRYHEEVLQKAYCRALGSIGQKIRTSHFQGVIGSR